MRSWPRRVAAIFAILALTACTERGVDGESTAGSVRIGVLAPLSGPNAAAGQNALRGAQLAAKLVNENQAQIPLELGAGAGLPGLDNRTIELVPADTKSDPGIGSTAAANLAAENVAGLIGAHDSVVTDAASQRTERIGVPFVSGNASAAHLTERGLDWFFRTGPTGRTLSEALFSVLQQQEAAGAETGSVAVIHPDEQAGHEFSSTIEELAAESGYEVTTALAYRSGTEDLSPTVRRVRDTDPDAVFVVAEAAADARRLLDGFAALDYTPPGIFGLGSGFAATSLTQGGVNAEGVFRSVSWSPELAARNPAATSVLTLYQETYNTPMDVTAAGAFMAVLTLAEGINESGSVEPQAVRTALTILEKPGRTTIMPWDGVRFDATGQNAAATGTVEQFRNGQPLVVFPQEISRQAPAWPLTEIRAS